MSGLLDKTNQNISLLQGMNNKLNSFKQSNLSLSGQIDTLMDSITASISSQTNISSSATNAITSMFSMQNASLTLGLNNAAQCICSSALDSMTPTFMESTSKIFQGNFMNSILDKTQQLSNTLNNIQELTRDTLNQINSSFYELSSYTDNILSKVDESISNITNITNKASEFVQAQSFMNNVITSCIDKNITFGLPSVKDMMSNISPILSLSLDIGLKYEPSQIKDAVCELIGTSGIGDEINNSQSKIKENLSFLEGI